jgi:Leucine-rich repeat (LRR) protein
MPMSHQTVPLARPDLESLSESKRERLESRLRRGKALRLAFIVALFLVFGSLFAAFLIRVGTHLVAAWWFESLHCTVAWEVLETNWREGGTTSVSYGSRYSWNAKFDDDDLDHLRKLWHLVKLDLAECITITNSGLAKLRGLTFLEELNLARLDRFRLARNGVTSVSLTDSCVIQLRALARLEKLTLAGNLITNGGLAQIANMANLKTLDLEATEVSDAGLVHLEGMKNLNVVYLGATHVTKEGLAKLQMARPDLTIELDVEPAVEQGVKLRRGVSP